MTGETEGDPRRGRGPVMGQRRLLALRSVRGAVGKGRDFSRLTLRDWGWDGRESAEDALLVVSELVTNAALHAHGCEELVLTAGETLRIEVLDGVTELPRPGAVRRPGVPGGHGLPSCGGSPTGGAVTPLGRARSSGRRSSPPAWPPGATARRPRPRTKARECLSGAPRSGGRVSGPVHRAQDAPERRARRPRRAAARAVVGHARRGPASAPARSRVGAHPAPEPRDA